MTLGFLTWLLGTTDHNLPRGNKRPKRTGSSLHPSPGQYSEGRTSTLPRFAFKTNPEKGFQPGRGIQAECSISLEQTRLECHQAGSEHYTSCSSAIRLSSGSSIPARPCTHEQTVPSPAPFLWCQAQLSAARAPFRSDPFASSSLARGEKPALVLES